MTKIQIISLIVFISLSGCSTVGQISSNESKKNSPQYVTDLIDWSLGKTLGELIEYAGKPGAIEILNNSMVAQYCSTGFFTDKYVQLFIYKKRVVGSYQTNAYIADGFCSQAFPSPQWLNAPEVVINDVGLTTQ